MPFNKEVFRTRALSAVFFVIIMLAGLLWNHWSFLVLFTIIHFGCWHEFLNLLEKMYAVKFNRLLRIGLMLAGFAMMLSFCGKAYTVYTAQHQFMLRESLCFPISLAGFLLLAIGIIQSNPFSIKAFGAAALGLLYISLSWGMMIELNDDSHLYYIYDWKLISGCLGCGNPIPIVLIASIWINDTMAYIVGSFIGKTPFSKISPKKTWEGTAGGAILCVLAVTLAGHFAFNLAIVPLIVISAIAAVIGTLGDLLESKLKRVAGVKDSGTMMPGHGGFMDRFDSLLLATPFVWLYVHFALG